MSTSVTDMVLPLPSQGISASAPPRDIAGGRYKDFWRTGDQFYKPVCTRTRACRIDFRYVECHQLWTLFNLLIFFSFFLRRNSKHVHPSDVTVMANIGRQPQPLQVDAIPKSWLHDRIPSCYGAFF